MLKQQKIILTASIFVFLCLTILIGTTTWGKGRFNQTSLFSNSGISSQISNDLKTFFIDEGQNKVVIARIFHNKIIAYSQRFTQEYFSYLSPDFLVGSHIYPYRYRIPHVGLIYLTFLIPLASFLITNKQKIEDRTRFYFLYLLLVSIIPSAITVDDSPNMHRALFMMVPLSFFIACGLLNLQLILKTIKQPFKNTLTFLFVALFIIELIYSSHQYYIHAGSIQGYARNEGNVELGKYLVNHKQEYKKIIVSDSTSEWPSLYYLYSSDDFSKNYAGKFGLNFSISNIDNIYFDTDPCPSGKYGKTNTTEQILIVDGGGCQTPQGLTTVGEIQRKDGTFAYKFLTFKK